MKNLISLPIIFLAMTCQSYASELVIIGHDPLPHMDSTTLQRIYTGKVVTLDNQTIYPVNLTTGNPLRQDFLVNILKQDEEKYTGYWVVRRYIGKGTPPKELATEEEVVHFVTTTPGGIGYIEKVNLPANTKVTILNH